MKGMALVAAAVCAVLGLAGCGSAGLSEPGERATWEHEPQLVFADNAQWQQTAQTASFILREGPASIDVQCFAPCDMALVGPAGTHQMIYSGEAAYDQVEVVLNVREGVYSVLTTMHGPYTDWLWGVFIYQ